MALRLVGDDIAIVLPPGSRVRSKVSSLPGYSSWRMSSIISGCDGVAVGVRVDVLDAVGVALGGGVAVGVGVSDGVAVGEGTAVALAVAGVVGEVTGAAAARPGWSA